MYRNIIHLFDRLFKHGSQDTAIFQQSKLTSDLILMDKMTKEVFILDSYDQQIERLQVTNENLEEKLKIQTGMTFKHASFLFD